MAEKFDLFKDISDSADAAVNYVGQKHPENLWMFDIQKVYWNEVHNAKALGKKLIYMGACVPMELLYAFDCTPMLLDMLPTRLCTTPELAAKYIDIAEEHVAASMCGIDKVDLGTVLSGDIPEKPDAFIYSTVPCDSSRVAYPAIDKHLGVPSYCMDIPYRKDETGYKYIADQNKEIITFLEDLTGTKLNMDKLKEVMEISDKTMILMKKIADLRKNHPCPLPGALLFLNQLIPAMAGHPEMLKCMEAQYAVAKHIVDHKMGAVKKENFRVLWLQNMLWCNLSALHYMEKTYGAIVVMEAFGYQETDLFNGSTDIDEICYISAKKALALPMIHGSSGPVEDYLHLVDDAMEAYDIDVAMYVGHVGCKHCWAAEKILKDMVQDKYGVPMMSLDVDAVDIRYKNNDEMVAVFKDFFDTLIENKKE